MRDSRVARYAALTTLSFFLVCPTGATPAQARVPDEGANQCVDVYQPDVSDSARGGRGTDHRDVSAEEQKRITARANKLAAAKPTAAADAPVVPVYVHVMAARNGTTGNVSDAAIAGQIEVLNKTYGGTESTSASNTGFTFTLAGTDRFFNDSWHKDKSSSTYRKATRKGGANALNIWLVDFSYLGIATFPWDYARSGAIDGVRVNYASLPGGSIANYNLGETGTHEVGHWLGLYHTFQGGCTPTNDEVTDTPAQSGSTNGCPEGADTCTLPGLDPIHNYMDYSYDTCYTMFTAGQTSRMNTMWTAYRALNT
jgi:hypothetical protein